MGRLATRRFSGLLETLHTYLDGGCAMFYKGMRIDIKVAIFPPGDEVLATQFLITFISLGYGLLVGMLLLTSSVFRQILRAVPASWLVAPHAIRLAGFLFLALTKSNSPKAFQPTVSARA